MPESLMQSFFQPLFEKIEKKVADLLKDARNTGSPVNFVFMVGGFSESVVGVRFRREPSRRARCPGWIAERAWSPLS